MSVLRCLIALAFLVVPLRAERVAVFLAAGQSNASYVWASGVRQGFQESGLYSRFEVVGSEHSGSQLSQWFNNGAPTANYADDLTKLQAAMAAIRDAGDTPVFKGLIWMQGEGDCIHEVNVANYVARFHGMLEQYRIDLGLYESPKFVLGIVDLNSNPLYDDPAQTYTTRERIDALRAQQFLLAAEPNGTSVDTRGIPRVDAWHLPWDQAVILGKRMAAAWLEKFYVPKAEASAAEEKAATKGFRKADRNRDGAISHAEFLALMSPGKKARTLRKRLGTEDAATAIDAACRVIFEWFDEDSSKTLDAEEWLAGRVSDPAVSAPPFDRLPEALTDLNQDGQQSYKEFVWVLRGLVPLARCREWYHPY